MTKQCVICKGNIIEEKEKWVRLSDFNKKQQTGEIFYHLECWRDRFNISNSIRKQKMYKQAQDAMGNIGKMMKQIMPDQNPTKFYEIAN